MRSTARVAAPHFSSPPRAARTPHARQILSDPRLHYLARRLAGARPGALEVASDVEVLHPGLERDAPPARILEGQTALITAAQEETTMEEQLLRLRGGHTRHAATLRLLLEDALLVGGDLYAGGMRMPLRPGTRPHSALARVAEEVDSAALVQTYNGSRYFGHWLLDDRPTGLMAPAWGVPTTVPIPLSEQQRSYLELFGQERRREAQALRVRRLHVFVDVGQNPHRTARIEALRARFQALGRRSTAALGSGQGRVVFVCRGHAGCRRVLLNEGEIARSLARRGALVIEHPERMSVSSLAASLTDARVVVGLDSSGLAHGILGVARGGGFVVISPADRHNNTFKDWCDPLGVTYGVVIAPRADGGYVVREDHVLRTLDLVLAARMAA